ncbi:MAG: class II fructose-bisphosphate aldolase [Pseudomonadales bacterium]|nr:class II fructose-bisphosphate aldolase [Pseudomonadales bacterium]
MSLTPIREMLHKAAAEGYAIGYFESWNLESLQGTIDAAEMNRSPTGSFPISLYQLKF